GRRREGDRDALGTRRRIQPLNGRDDLVGTLAGEGVAGAGPGVGKVDVDERGPLAESDAPLEAALLIDRGVRREDALEGCSDFVAAHAPEATTPLSQSPGVE